MPLPRLIAISAWLMGGWPGVTPLQAQQALYVSDGERASQLVRKIVEGVPYVSEKGKLVALTAPKGSGFRYSLKPAEEFYPAFVSVRNPQTDYPAYTAQNARQQSWRFQFSGTFASDYALKNVFLVFEFETPADQKNAQAVWVRGLATYELEDAKLVLAPVNFPDGTPRTNVKLHVFSDGLEVFHSGLPREFIEEKLTQMAAKRIAKLKDAAPRPLAGPIPRYPEKLRKAKITGRAIVSCEIAPTGQPTNPVVKSATDPAFGEAALAVMSQSWFLPKVENGRPVAQKAELPFDFTPPKS